MPNCNHASQPTGELALILGLAVRSKNATLLQQLLREMGINCSDKEAKWAFTNAQADMTQQEIDWLQAHLQRIYQDPENSRKVPVYSYLWQSTEANPLEGELHTRVTQAEKQAFVAIAHSQGISPSALQRQVLRSYMNLKN
jgi:hypothetical protein